MVKQQLKKPEFRIQTTDGPLENIHSKALKIDLGKLGHLSGPKNQSVDPKYIKLITAGIMNKLNISTEGAITVRPIMPKYDFMLYDDSFPNDNTWNVIISPNNYQEGSPIDQYVYRTDEKKTRMEYKCMILLGIEYSPRFTNIDEVNVWRTGTRLIDRFVLEHNHDEDTFLEFATPIIFGQSRNMNHLGIAATLVKDKIVNERLKIHGYVAEPLGIPASD